MDRNLTRWIREMDSHMRAVEEAADTDPNAIAVPFNRHRLLNMMSCWRLIRADLVSDSAVSAGDEAAVDLDETSPLWHHEQAMRTLFRLLTVPRYINTRVATITFDEIRELKRTWDDVLVATKPAIPLAKPQLNQSDPEFAGNPITITVQALTDGSLVVSRVHQEDK